MNNKYIIRNCPAYGECFLVNECQDCADCVMKQIVELCKYYKNRSDCDRSCPSFGSFLNKLLDKLNIQEVK